MIVWWRYKVNTIPRPRPLDAERAAHARRRHDGVRGVRPGAGAGGIGGEDTKEPAVRLFCDTTTFLKSLARIMAGLLLFLYTSAAP